MKSEQSDESQYDSEDSKQSSNDESGSEEDKGQPDENDEEYNETNESNGDESQGDENDEENGSSNKSGEGESEGEENTDESSESNTDKDEQGEDYGNYDDDDYGDYYDDEQGDYDEGQDYSEDDEQEDPGQYNAIQAVMMQEAKDRRLKTAFYQFIERIAEQETKYEIPGASRYSMKQIMLRKFNHKALSATKVDRIKDTVVVLLDTSGSMDWWADLLKSIATVLLQRDDIELYYAPNGNIESKVDKNWKEMPVKNVNLKDRTIVYIGDFDGGDVPVILSWNNKVYWFCNENRYDNFLDHDWMHYNEREFKGMFFKTYDGNDLLQALKIATTTQYRKGAFY
ncbi:MAG: hypothetical protein QXJ24_06180 [Thermoplasmatales archaeon]